MTVDRLGSLGAPSDESLDRARLFHATPAITGTVDLAGDLALTYSIPFDRSRIDLEAHVRGLVVWRATLDETRPMAKLRGNHGVVKADIVVSADLRLGELRVHGDVCPCDAEMLAFSTVPFDNHVVCAFSPSLGEVDGKITAHAPMVRDPDIGASESVVLTITRIPVDMKQRVGTPVGNIVKQRLFPTTPDFVFNVCFAVGPFGLFAPGKYGDPTSPWFNVFLGYYQIDAPKRGWTRPFGYDPANPAAPVLLDELLVLGKADWNYFSNWMYGVPMATVTPYDAPDTRVTKTYAGRTAIGARTFDVVDLDGFTAVSAYQSTAAGATRLADNVPVLTRLWRHTYGEPGSVDGHPVSFVPTTMHARFYMTYFEDADAYHTCLFGGTVNKAFDAALNDRFLAEQLGACEAVLKQHYPRLGFPPPR